MVTPPTFGESNGNVWSTTTSPKTASITVGAGDVLVQLGGTADNTTTLATPTGGTGLTWTLKQTLNASGYCALYGWTTTSASGQTFTLTQTRTGGTSPPWGFNCVRFSGSTGIGASSVTNTTGAPSLSITTTQANSAIVVFVGDWNAMDGSSRTWRTPSGSTGITTGGAGDLSYFLDSAQYAVYAGYHSDAGAAGAKTVGLSAPTGQQYAILAIEVLGTTTAAGSLPPVLATRRTKGGLLQL